MKKNIKQDILQVQDSLIVQLYRSTRYNECYILNIILGACKNENQK